MKTIEQKYRRLRYLAAFLVPLLLTVAVFAVMGFYPFGDSSTLTGDLNGIELPMYAELRYSVESGESLFYSFYKHLGGSLFSTARFFCGLELLFLFFDVTHYPILAELIMALYIALAGLSCYHALRYFNKRDSWFDVALSVGYAMMTYLFAYNQILMWQKFLTLLPLLLMLVDKFIETDRWLLYTAVLWLTINSFYYIGFMVCIFIIVFFFYRLSLSPRYLASEKRGLFALKKTAGMAGVSLLAVVGSLFYLLPTVMAANEKKGGLLGAEIFGLETSFKPIELFSKLGIGSFAWDDIMWGMPLLFCGTLATVLVLCFFAGEKIARREKIATGVIFLALFVMMWSWTLNVLWHGSSPPNWFPFRYAFIVCFFIVYVAARGLQGVEGLSKKRFAAVAVAAVVIVALGYFFTDNIPSIKRSLLTLAFMLFYTLSFYLQSGGVARIKPFFKKLLPVAVVAAVCVEMALNGYFTLSVFEYYPNSGYQQFIADNRQVLDYIRAQDDDFFRMDKNFNRTLNDPLLLGYYGMSHFSPQADDNQQLAAKLGYVNYLSSNLYGAGSTAFADAYLSVRYMWSDADPEHQVGAHFERIDNGELPYRVYKNDYTMPLAFVASGDVTGIDMDEKNTFLIQDAMLRAMAGGEQPCFLPCETETAYDAAAPAKYADYTFEAVSDGWCYAVLDCDNTDGLFLTVNDVHYIGTYPTELFRGVINLGYFEAGETVTLSCIAYGAAVYINETCFYQLDAARFGRAVEEINGRGLQNAVIENGYVSGTAQADAGDILSTTLLYADSWVVTVNGRPAETVELFGCMMGVVLQRGTNEIVMRYTVTGFRTGIYISCVAVAVYAVLAVRDIRKRKKAAALLPK